MEAEELPCMTACTERMQHQQLSPPQNTARQLLHLIHGDSFKNYIQILEEHASK